MNYAPNQQNASNRVPQVHPPPPVSANASAMSSDQRELMQNQSFPSNANAADHLKHSQPIPTGGHQRFPQPNNNMGNPPGVQQNFGNQGVHNNLQALMTDPQFFQKFSENFNSISHIHQMAASIQIPPAANQHHGVLPPLQKLTAATSSLSGVQNQAINRGNAMNFGVNPLRQFSPPKASHPQLKTTPTTSKVPQLAGNNVPNKPQLQPSAASETAAAAPAMSSPSQPASSQQPTTPQKQQPANNSQNKNVPSTPPQNSAVATSSPSAAKKGSPSTGAPVQTTQKTQNSATQPAQTASITTCPPKSVPAAQTTLIKASNPTPAVPAATSPTKPNESIQSSSAESKASESSKVAPIIATTPNKSVPIPSNPPAAKPIIESDKTPTKSTTVAAEQPKLTKVAPTTPSKTEEKKTAPPTPIVTAPKSTVVDKQQLSPSIPKSSMRLATVTPPRHKKPPPTRKSATGVEKQPPIRTTKPTIAAAQKSPAIQPRAVAASTPTDTSPKVKRSRVQVQPYQCPTRNLELATKLSTKFAYQEKKETEQEKLIIFYKNEFLAVRNEEGTFYLCQAAQNVYKPAKSSKIRIQWLNERDAKKQKSKEGGRVFSFDYMDHTDFECVLTTVELNKVDSKSFELPKEECARIENILKKAMDLEKGKKPVEVTEDNPDGLDLSLYESEAQLESKSNRKRKSKYEESDSSDEEDSKPLVKKKKPEEPTKKVEKAETPAKKIEEKAKENAEVKKENPGKNEKPKKSPVKAEPQPSTSIAAEKASKTRTTAAASPAKNVAKVPENPGPSSKNQAASSPSKTSPAKSSPSSARATRKK